MVNKFLSLLQKEYGMTHTENGANALRTTSSSLLDLFGTIGSLRCRDEMEIERLFSAAFHEDPLLATKMAFYARNIRGGLGERRTFRVILKYLAVVHPHIVIKNLDAIALFGRYDDFYTLVGTPVEKEMWLYLKNQFELDLLHLEQNQPISLLAKWLKSVNASSRTTNYLGKLTAKNFGLSAPDYRKALSKLRKALDVTEVKMSANAWTDIIYSAVPSRAMSIYRHAFKAHDESGFNTYIEALTNGEAKINATALYPYDIFERMGLTFSYQYGSNNNSHFAFNNYDPILEAQWKALPNYVDEGSNVLVMADTSGSMTCMNNRPLCSALSLATYFAERNTGAFKDVFMTFSQTPSLVSLKGNTLYDKIKNIPSIVANTNLEAAFDMILKVAITNHIAQDELPKALVIISDMEFDYATNTQPGFTFYDSMVKKFARHNYRMPNIIFWNVNSRHDIFQTNSKYKGVQLASGQSPSVFQSILSNIDKTPYEAMLNVLNDPLYDCITI